jgi:hypothetical protein
MLQWNAYDIAKEVFTTLGVNSTNLAAVLAGTHDEGIYTIDQVKNAINFACRKIYTLVAKRLPENEFMEGPTDIVFTSSVATLPSNFGRMVELRDPDGLEVFPVQAKDLRRGTEPGLDRFYIRQGSTLKIDKASVSGTYTMYYVKTPRMIDFGVAAAGAAASITLATSAVKTVDYYNGMSLVDVTQDWVDTIDDYAVTRVCTISETAAASDIYGIVPELPEPFHYLVAPIAAWWLGSQFPMAKTKPAPNSYQVILETLNETLGFFASPSLGEDEDLFTDRPSAYSVSGVPARWL